GALPDADHLREEEPGPGPLAAEIDRVVEVALLVVGRLRLSGRVGPLAGLLVAGHRRRAAAGLVQGVALPGLGMERRAADHPPPAGRAGLAVALLVDYLRRERQSGPEEQEAG